MSRHRPRYKRSPDNATPVTAAPPGVPVVLPHVVATVGSDERLTVVIDGVTFTPAPIGRTAFGTLLDEIIRVHGASLRVEIIEANGTTYTDILTPGTILIPPTIVHPAPTPPPVEVAPIRHVQTGPRLVEVTGEGFVPGEDVALAVIVRHGPAGGTGIVRQLIEEGELGATGEVVLFGRISGTTTLVRALTGEGDSAPDSPVSRFAPRTYR